MVAAFIEACHTLVKKYKYADEKPICRIGDRSRECDALFLENLMKELKSIQIWPGDPQEIVRGLQSKSADEIFKDIRRLKQRLKDDKTNGSINDSHSLSGFGSVLSRIVDEVTSKASQGTTLLDSHRRHLETQRGKLQPSRPNLSNYQS